jgi:DNA polymerase III subunit beta
MAVKERKRTGGTTLSAAELRKCLRTVADAVASRGVKPVLANVRLGDGLLTATNLEVRIETAIDYHGDPMLLPHGRMLAILGTAAGTEVTLTPSGTSCVVECGRGRWTLPLEDANEFPTWEPEGLVSVVRIPGDEFARAVQSVLPAHDNESSRYALGAMLVSVDGDEACFVATDGRRLHLAKVSHDQAVDTSETLIPAGVARTLYRLASHAADEGVQIERSGTIVRAEIGDTTVTARQVEGRFPRWRDVLPKDGPSLSTVERGTLESATASAAIVTSEQSKGVTYAWTKEGLHLTAKSSEAGESSVTCELVECGHACSVILDPAYVLEWLRALPAEAEPTISVQAKDRASAVVLRNDCYTGVIMPLDPSAT